MRELVERHEYYSNLGFWEQFSSHARDKACSHILGPSTMVFRDRLTMLQKARVRHLTGGYAMAYLAVAQETGLQSP